MASFLILVKIIIIPYMMAQLGVYRQSDLNSISVSNGY